MTADARADVAAGTVADTLWRLRGVWHDVLTAFHPDGTPMSHDEHGSVPGPYPYENLVYIDFDGAAYAQTNVTVKGRPLHARSFTATLVDGVLVWDHLGTDDPGHIGVGAGDGAVIFTSRRNDHEGGVAYSEPDLVQLLGEDTRRRTTFLYRFGELVRTLRVDGERIATDPTVRVAWDPRGAEGPVHDGRLTTNAFTGGTDE